MNRRQKIIVSVTGIFLVLLILVGLTYAYFLTQITGNTNEKSISVTTADLRLTYGDGTTQILTSDTKLVPSSNPIGTKDFTVTNDGDATSYAVIIENVIAKDATTEELTTFNSNDFVYTLSCTSNNGTCNGVTEQTVLPMSDAILVENDIEKDEVHTYEIVVYYLETNKDQSSDMNKKLEARINIEDVNRINPYSSNTNSLAYNIINNALNVTNDEINGGYAAYRSTPLTNPAEETTNKFIFTPETDYLYKNQQSYCPYYMFVGDDYNFNYLTGKFSLVNPSLIDYCENLATLEDKYFIGSAINFNFDANDINYMAYYNNSSYIYKFAQSLTNTAQYGYTEIGTVTRIPDTIENTLSKSQDDYSSKTGNDSYYFRGDVKNNFIEFNNMCWRIVRIEGDGSVKLTLAKEGLCSSITVSDTESAFIGKGDYGSDAGSAIDNSYNYENTANSSTSIKYKLYEWFDGYLSDNNTKRFSDEIKTKIKMENVCIGNENTYLDEWIDSFGSESYIQYSDNFKRIAIDKNPSFKCDEGATSLKKYQIYPLNVDETIFAGMFYLKESSSYLSNNANSTWWTSSIYGNSGGSFSFTVSKNIIDDYMITDDYFVYIRPAISLIPNIEIQSGGIGTIDNPYRVIES